MKKPDDSNGQASNGYAKWTGLGFQMMAVIAIFIWGGLWLDKHFALKFPAFTVSLALLGIGGSLYSVYKRVAG